MARKTRTAAARLPSEKLFRIAVEAAPSAMVMTDRDGRIVMVNAQTLALFGYRREELVGRTIETVIPERFRKRHVSYRRSYGERPAARAMGAGRDLFGLRKDGTEFPVEIGLNPIETEEGNFALASIIDITARKKSEELFQIAVEAAPNAMVMAAADGRIVLVNSQAERLFGYGRAELVGRPIEVLIPERSRKRHADYREGYAARPETRAMGAGRDLFGLRKNGDEIPVEIGLNPVETPQGRFILASIIDITERKALEKRLAQSEAMAAVGGMAAAVAHEIRNPLGSIVMGAKALARGGLSPEDLNEVQAVLVNESQRLNRTLDDFLQFARPREPKRVPGDLNLAAHEVVVAVKADEALVGRAVIAEVHDPELSVLRFDPDLIRQVFWNVLRNGLQAMRGKGRLEVRTERRADQAVVHFTDSGPGIPREQLERVFMPFYTTKSKGTGLGLSISRNIVVAHGGDIQISSHPGRGSRVSIVLPVSR